MQRVLESMIPVSFFLYLIGVMMAGGVTLLAATLPTFTIVFAIFGAWVFYHGSLQKAGDNNRVRNRK